MIILIILIYHTILIVMMVFAMVCCHILRWQTTHPSISGPTSQGRIEHPRPHLEMMTGIRASLGLY